MIQQKEMKMKTPLSQDKKLTRANRTTTFTFEAPTARQVWLAGDFNGWDPRANPMHKSLDGMWHLGVALESGRYEYRFVADEIWCDDPAAELKTSNVMGTQNCVLFV